MTRQPQPDPVEPETVVVQVAVGVAPGPTGRPWVQLQLSVGVTAIALQIPEKTARELAGILRQSLTDGADNARRAALGIIVPNSAVPAPNDAHRRHVRGA